MEYSVVVLRTRTFEVGRFLNLNIEQTQAELVNIKLAPELEVLVEQKVSSGQYPSAHRVIEAALLLLDERDRQTQQLRTEIMIGIEQSFRKKSFAFFKLRGLRVLDLID